MANYLVKHRRGTSSQIKAAKLPIQEGELVIEYSDDYSMARILIGNRFGYDALAFSAVSKIRTISLPVSKWQGDKSPYSQKIETEIIGGVTKNSKIDLNPTIALLEYLQEKEIALIAENTDGVVTVYSLFDKPDIDIEIQATISEVVADSTDNTQNDETAAILGEGILGKMVLEEIKIPDEDVGDVAILGTGILGKLVLERSY